MPTEGTPRSSFRLRPEHLALIEEIGEARGGLSKTRVIELAVERLAHQVLGRRAADLAPARRRAGRAED